MRATLAFLVLVGVVSVNGDCNCGWSNNGRIVGGVETRKNAYPLVVALEDPHGFQFCGGTILTPRHVITAAHCTVDETANTIRIRAGGHDLRSRQGTVYEVLKIKNHERYNNDKLENDIALLVTKKAIKFDQNVGPACLPSGRLSLTGQNLRALGWGLMWNKGSSSEVLREVVVQAIPFSQCQHSWSSRKTQPIEANNVCTYSAGKDTCQGDSGGPLIWLNPATRRYTLAALVSFGGSCAGPLPAVNTDVSAYLPWINSNIKATAPGVEACIKG